MNEKELGMLFCSFREGNNEAFSEIYNELKKPVFTIAYRITFVREIAEDITQELFLKLYTSPPDASVRNPRAWIFRMARNLAIDALRKKQCSDIDEVTLSFDDTERINTGIDIEKALSSLSLSEREIVSLHIDGGLGFREIGKALGISLTSAYRKYKSALNKLRRML
ncbi:MAG: sigma-70 family RNA polymerase sigma factor [Clostridia bacterium]|nr:sigma-70 family RNA polymerase sigma factor [Clostridia bacterium]